MFDIGFSEMMVIAVVALVVIGPEKLPRVARTVGAYLGRLQRYVNDVKADINREIELDELRKFKQQVEDTARGFESSVREEIHKTETEFNQVAQDLTGAAPTTGEAAGTSAQGSNSPATSTDTLPAGSDGAAASTAGTALHSSPPASPSSDPAVAGATASPSTTSDVAAKRAA